MKQERKGRRDCNKWVAYANYFFCPALCMHCKHFARDTDRDTGYPYTCNEAHPESASLVSIKAGFGSCNDCKAYEEKTEEKKSVDKKEYADFCEEHVSVCHKEDDGKRESCWRDESSVGLDEDCCYYCGQPRSLVELYGEFFHRKCQTEFLETSEGKDWLAKKEQEAKELKESRQKALEDGKRQEEDERKEQAALALVRAEEKREKEEFLASPEGEAWLAERLRKKEVGYLRITRKARTRKIKRYGAIALFSYVIIGSVLVFLSENSASGLIILLSLVYIWALFCLIKRYVKWWDSVARKASVIGRIGYSVLSLLIVMPWSVGIAVALLRVVFSK